MIKFAFAAIWIAAAALGSVYYSFNNTMDSAGDATEPSFFGGLDYLKTGIISVPLFRDGRVYGYFLARLVYTVEPEKLKQLALPAESLLVDQVYSYLYGNPLVDFASKNEMDLTNLKEGIRDSINERVGDKLVYEVMIEQIDFLSKTDIRDNTIRRRSSTLKMTDSLTGPVEEEAGEGGGDAGHGAIKDH